MSKTTKFNAKAARALTAEARANMNMDKELVDLYKDLEETSGLGYDELTTTRINDAAADGRHQFIIDAMVKALEADGYRVSSRVSKTHTIMWN